MIVELGFDELPAEYLRLLSEKRKEFRKIFGYNASFYLTPRRIVLRFDPSKADNLKDKILNFIRCDFREMRWREGEQDKFVRPLRWILAINEDKVIDIEIFGVKSSNFTVSHRALGNRKIYITSEKDYFEKISNEAKVEISHTKRREKIEKILRENGVEPSEYKDLLDMAVFSTEYPDFVSSEIEAGKVPPKIAEKIMTDFVFVFPVKGKRTVLGDEIKGFVAVIDNPNPDKEAIKCGYIFVIKSRFEDAEFYIEEDKKIPMSQRIHLLSDIVYSEKFGSFYDRAVFVSKVADFINAKLLLSERSEIRRAVMLSKADITTGLFREFPEHQGYIGMFYLLHEGEDEKIAKAVFEHRFPEKQEDPIPETELGKIISLADKLAHVFLSFVSDLPVTSEEDPFGIRRAARSAIRIMIEGKIDINLVELAEFLAPLIKEHLEQRGISTQDVDEKIGNAIVFILERTEVFLSEMFRKEFVKSVLARVPSPYDAYERIKALSENDPSDLFYVAKRVGNIIEQAHEKGLLDESKLNIKIKNGKEKELLEVVEQIEKEEFIKEKRYTEFIKFFSTVRKKVDDFFNSLMVLSPDEEERNTRLAILVRLYSQIDSFMAL